MHEKLVKRLDFWKQTAQEEIETAKILLDKQKTRQCLFFIHLSIEKILKSLYIKQKNENPPRTHNLRYLAGEIGVGLSAEREEFLIEATAFNIEARYPDEESPKPEYEYAKEQLLKAQRY